MVEDIHVGDKGFEHRIVVSVKDASESVEITQLMTHPIMFINLGENYLREMVEESDKVLYYEDYYFEL